jgi:hypothetical protein
MLLREIERQTMDEMLAIREAAEREARIILAQAHADARRRMRDAVKELRRDCALRVARVKAELEAEAQMCAQKDAADAIMRAWPLLTQALDARWKDFSARSLWVEGVAHYARDRLMPGRWTVEHPPGWGADEQRRFCELLGNGRNDINFTIDPGITAGIRIRAGQATLDATSQGLLADHGASEALLLGEIWSRADSERPRLGAKK